jgi:HK97 family phage prohead protease
VDLVRMRDSSDTGPAPTKRTPPPPRGGTRQNRDYKRDKDGQFNEVDERGGSRNRGSRPMTAHEKHVAHVGHVKRVKALQRLLNKLGHNVAVDGKFGPETKKVVNALQRKLGMRETGAVTGALMKALRHAEILSPCAKGAKRSREMDELDELIRAVGVEPDDELEEEYEDEAGLVPAALTRCCPSEHTFARDWTLEGIEILRSGQGGDGRTVEAYAAVFDTPTEIKDQHGHYIEDINRAAFNEAVAEGIHRAGYFYHHGMTLAGTPSDLGSVPIGSPVLIRPDGKGLLTRSRLNKSALAEATLEAIRNGDITAYSFRGPIKRSNPPRIPRARPGAPLPTVTRMALGLTEYGPTPIPYYADAKILAVRSAQTMATQLVDPDFRRELITILSRSTPQDQGQEPATPTEGPGAEDQPQEALRSASMEDIRRRIAVFKILGGIKS